MPYLYLSYKTTIKVSHIITSTSKKYENTDTNFFPQLGLINYCKLESPGVCKIALGCPGCISSNHTQAMVGIDKSNIYQYFKILYALVHNCFLGGGRNEDMEFGAGNCMFEFITMMHIMQVLSEKYVGLLSTELILSLIYICSILWGWVNTYSFLVD